MRRTFVYFAAFTGMGTVFAATLLVAALVLGSATSGAHRPPASTGSARGPSTATS